MRRRVSLGGLLLGLLLGAGTEAALLGWAMVDPVRIDAWTEVFVLRGDGDAWLGGERTSGLVRWINIESVGPLVSRASVPTDELPSWMRLPDEVGARHVRAAAVGIGWPFRPMGMRWVADRGDEGFPPPAEKESSGDAPKEAVRRLRDALLAEGGGGPGAGVAWFSWPAFAADAAILAIPWWALLAWVAARRRAITPRG